MGKQIRYTPEFKMQTVQMYLQGNLSANQLALDLGIHPHTVRHWIQDYNDGKLKIIPRKQQESSTRPDIGLIISKISELESEITELKTFLQAYLLKR